MRPLLHHTPETGWVNDPYALTWHDDRYHLFFQYVPGRVTWDLGCQWGHATSTDLLTWEQQPVALPLGDGDDGCWSGSLAGGVIFYTSVAEGDPDRGRVRRAVPDDDGWTTWTKQEVVVEAPPEATHFRDPFVLRDAEGWRMVVGCATEDGRRCGPTVPTTSCGGGPKKSSPRGREASGPERPGSARPCSRSTGARSSWSACGSRTLCTASPTRSAPPTRPGSTPVRSAGCPTVRPTTPPRCSPTVTADPGSWPGCAASPTAERVGPAPPACRRWSRCAPTDWCSRRRPRPPRGRPRSATASTRRPSASPPATARCC